MLRCPDDGFSLVVDNRFLSCTKCARQFQVDGNFMDLRPSSALDIDKHDDVGAKYDLLYQNLVNAGSLGRDRSPFGLASKSVSPGFFKETASFLWKRIGSDYIVCDVGAGSGDYSVNLASNCKIMLHCDLDREGMALARKNAESRGLENIFFVCCDYFFLPFVDQALDFVYTVDVLERGAKHDRSLLGEMIRITKKGGNVCFDCHTKERSRITGVEASSDRYSKDEITALSREFALNVVDIVGTGFIPQVRIWSESEYKFLNFLAKAFKLPPARWMLSCRPA